MVFQSIELIKNTVPMRISGGAAVNVISFEHPEEIPPEDSLTWSAPFNEWPDEPEIIKIGFKEGVPCAIDDEPMTPLQVIEKCHAIGTKHGCGWVQTMEDRVVGLKSRETYELPAASIIMPAHKALEKYV